jgi:Flp pilus assembly protein TadB
MTERPEVDMNEQSRFLVFVTCLTFAIIMAVSAFTSFPVWHAAFALAFGIGAWIYRPRRKRSRD